MMRLHKILCVLVAGCGTLAPDGGGATDLPVSGAGPYGKLAPNDAYPFQAPYVLSDAGADLDDPYVLAWGDLLATWVTYTVGHTSEIRHADFFSLETGSTGFIGAIQPAEAWEGNRVAQPAILWTSPWLLFYSGAGGIGYATSPDGHAWTKAPGPALVATADEGAISSPAAILIGDTVRLFYLASDGVRAADARFADLAARAEAPFQRRAGVVIAPGAASWLPSPGRLSARNVLLATGRERYDLFLSGSVDGVRAVGFASSFDGESFAIAAAPFLDPRSPDEWSPTVTAYRAGSLLLFTQQEGQHSAIGAATSP